MRAWLFTNTFYGNWLPGDERGSVTRVRDQRPGEQPTESRVEHDRPGTEWEAPIPGLFRRAQAKMKGPVVALNAEQAEVLLTQFEETSRFRQWDMMAVAIMRNHLHWVAGIGDEETPAKVLADFKAWGSRALNRRFGRPVSGTWWTTKGSKRHLLGESSLVGAVHYVTPSAGVAIVALVKTGRTPHTPLNSGR